jgi:hypothetical protein
VVDFVAAEKPSCARSPCIVARDLPWTEAIANGLIAEEFPKTEGRGHGGLCMELTRMSQPYCL